MLCQSIDLLKVSHVNEFKGLFTDMQLAKIWREWCAMLWYLKTMCSGICQSIQLLTTVLWPICLVNWQILETFLSRLTKVLKAICLHIRISPNFLVENSSSFVRSWIRATCRSAYREDWKFSTEILQILPPQPWPKWGLSCLLWSAWAMYRGNFLKKAVRCVFLQLLLQQIVICVFFEMLVCQPCSALALWSEK